MKISLAANSALLKPDFTFGVATASFQIEGAADSRLPCIWDTFCAEPGRIKDGSDGLVACDHISHWREDVELIASLGVDAYRFSIAWGRVINIDGSVNTAGLDFYRQLLDALRARNIKAFVTLYHWDLPQYLQDNGGWLNRETAYKFADYADKVSQAFGDRVYSYATLNEPFCSAYLSYEAGIHAPGVQNRKQGRQVAHHLLLAHGLAMKVLQQNAPQALNGIVLNFSPCHPASNSDADRRAARMADQYHNQWYIQPLMEGRYPELLQQLALSEQPDIAAGDMTIIAQPLDFLGVNYYTRTVYRDNGKGWFSDVPPTRPPLTDMGWEIYPAGLTEILLDINQRYQLPPVYITENGAAMPDSLQHGQIQDTTRITYFQQHLQAVDDAISTGMRIDGYFAWSLMDNFEWAEGYAKRFGIVYVDYKTQQRTLKASAVALRDCFANRVATERQIANK
ncbi:MULTISPECIES: GH1 family beta-glucosidase [unclassified Arsukibacterium]|uniref:GH1 family beta-glucosidase n=1 Tax=unclassified Arsukibacterium TaxID=2635278 RepID=UPI000C6660A2|nr:MULTISPECIES: GH1 family beta-glucosidase [unclassified Arsukibacterium]MAA94686.1 beta-glucosidase [Rheinheimera sp.]MBM32730.1 beta-glucosidase [Rheinheimera sp.]HAW92507.1 beta-glucosidase [Candidatus Azambacteria bacterium]|tara:strand:+ start:70178 stop:71536 length:1359 start_codon:yes stop_codon:yes gene_type:complete